MMATVPHVTSGLGLRKFQADGFLLARVYQHQNLPAYKNIYSHGFSCRLHEHRLAASHTLLNNVYKLP